MRNLKSIQFKLVQPIPELCHAQAICRDCDSGIVYCAHATGIVGIDTNLSQIVHRASLTKDAYLPRDGTGRVVGLGYLPEQMALLIFTSTGNAVMWTVAGEELECVGAVESGFTAMAWSPDQETIALTTGDKKLIMMTRDCDVLMETTLHPDEFGEAEMINVGWGKKETQFHGSIGKDSAHQKHVAVGPVSVCDDGYPRISWRGDGEYFATNAVNPHTGARQIRVWTRHGTLHSTSECIEGLQEALCWKPSGSLIASSQRKPNKHDIIFLENNGLMHGEFTLPYEKDKVHVREVLWNTESTVLAVWSEDTQEQAQPTSYVTLWMVSNYHWYQKVCLKFEASSHVCVIMWDPEQAYHLHIVCSDGQYLCYAWSWVTNCSMGNMSNTDDQTTVAVIDGSKLLLTPFRTMIVPPPMCAYHIQLPEPVNQVIFAPPPNSNDLALLLADGTVAVCKYNQTGTSVDDSGSQDNIQTGKESAIFIKKCGSHVLKARYSLANIKQNTSAQIPVWCHHCTWLPDDTFIFVVLDADLSHSILYSAKLNISSEQIQMDDMHPVDGLVYNIAHNPTSGSVAIQLSDGALLKYDAHSGLSHWLGTAGESVNFPVPCDTMAVCEIGGQDVVLGLTNRYRLYVNNTEVCSNCTSFAIHDEFLLLTTLSHTLRCINRNTKVSVLPTLSDGKEHPFDESIRRLERGSRIVTVVPDDTKVILQMPRGNIETIHPRALVLSAVRKDLDQLEFKHAFERMKKHRINMNLIYDHNPERFVCNVDIFIRQINNVNHINLFLMDLQQEDVTKTMYTAAYHDRLPITDHSTQKSKVNKVDSICDALRKSLTQISEDRFVLSIITSHVKKTMPELEKALSIINALKVNPTGDVSYEDALKYLILLVDVNQLYDVALGTYNFDLVLMVAEKSQKDPKEYLPFLNKLRQLEPNYQRYTIDKYLRRYCQALESISKCPEKFTECLTLVKEHKLYSKALSLFKQKSQQYKDIALEYGAYLYERRDYDGAAIVYHKAELWAEALTAYEKAHNWRQCLCIASVLGYSNEQEIQLARRLANLLKEGGRSNEAAIVYEQHVKDIEEAIVVLIDATLWEESLRLMFRYKRTDFIETNLKPSIQHQCSEHIASIENLHSEFDRHKSRLDLVRQTKQKAHLEFLESGGVYNDAEADLYSDTSSVEGESVISRQTALSQRSTAHSKISGKSSRNRRKAERKKWSLKEGSPFEDLALIEAMSKTIAFVDSLRGEVSSLLRILSLYHYEKQAMELQYKYRAFLRSIEKSIPEIWPMSKAAATSDVSPILGPTATANTIAQAMLQGKGYMQTDILDPVFMVPPPLNKESKWELGILNNTDS